jgi:F-type H+-transporting ATPase subunit b
MNTVLSIVAFLIGLATVVYLATKSKFVASLMPFSAEAMRARRQRIDEALESAARSEKRLAEVRQEIEAEVGRARAQAEEIVVRARREAVAVTEETAIRARADAAAFIERARSDVNVERERAISELRRELSEMVVEGAGAILHEAIDEKTHQRLIDESLTTIATPQKGTR